MTNRFDYKLVATLALAMVGASMARANANGYGSAYASATYYESAAGLYVTSASGQYYSYSYSTVGSAWYDADYYYGDIGSNANNALAQTSGAYGISLSAPQPGGSGVSFELGTENYLNITNESNSWDTLYVDVYTVGYGSSYASSWNDFSYGVGVGEFFVSGVLLQESGAVAETEGLGGAGDRAYAVNYDIYNGSNSSSYYGGNIFPGFASAYASDYQVYAISFAPGATNTFVSYAVEGHEAYSITPGPTAVTPFIVGLIGALQRRKSYG